MNEGVGYHALRGFLMTLPTDMIRLSVSRVHQVLASGPAPCKVRELERMLRLMEYELSVRTSVGDRGVDGSPCDKGVSGGY